ncbi:MAG TPA: ROK family transcriptional regulator [Streptosporangiaceae bacterium]
MRNDHGVATTSAELRAHNLARLLRAVHDGGGQSTRAELTRQLGLARGTATVLVRELAARRLITELAPSEPPSAQRARGRPTGVPSANSEGPLALAVDLRDDSFVTAVFELTGRGMVLDSQERGTRDGRKFLAQVAANLRKHRRALDGRVVGTGVAVPSPLRAGRMVQPTLDDWKDVDVAHALHASVGNDATLAGLAEARRGVLRGIPVALHLHAATGIGGVLLTGGQPAIGALGSAGEFGHMPLAGGDEPCQCGATGCWEQYAGARGLLREAGLPPEQGDRMLIAARVIGSDAGALKRVAAALGRGIGALVNAHDPAAVSLSGLAAAVLTAAPEQVNDAYHGALMRFRRFAPPALLPSALGDLGPLTGAAELVFDGFLTARGLAAWTPPNPNLVNCAIDPL